MSSQIALTIKPTMNCNMKCRHCFNGSELNSSGFIDISLVKRFIKITIKEYDNVKVTFHGGEPSLAGYDFYREFYNFENLLTKKYGISFSNLFTTNGKSLSEDLMDLLIKNNVLINVSFDGPYNNILRDCSI